MTVELKEPAIFPVVQMVFPIVSKLLVFKFEEDLSFVLKWHRMFYLLVEHILVYVGSGLCNVLLVSGRSLWVLYPSDERFYTISDEVLAFALGSSVNS